MLRTDGLLFISHYVVLEVKYQSMRQQRIARLIHRAKMLSGKVTSLARTPKNTDSPFVLRIYFAFCCWSNQFMIYLGSRVVSWMGKALKVCFGGMQDLIANWNSYSQNVWPVTLSLSQLASAVASRLERTSSTAKLSLFFDRCSPINLSNPD